MEESTGIMTTRPTENHVAVKKGLVGHHATPHRSGSSSNVTTPYTKSCYIDTHDID